MTFKKIQAIIRVSKFEEVRKALHAIGVEFFTYQDVKGVAFQSNNKISYRGSSINEMTAIVWRNIEIFIPEIDAAEVVACIKKAAYTGTKGDGKIYLSTIDEAYRISNKDE